MRKLLEYHFDVAHSTKYAIQNNARHDKGGQTLALALKGASAISKIAYELHDFDTRLVVANLFDFLG